MPRLSEQERAMLLELWKARAISSHTSVDVTKKEKTIGVLQQQGLIEVKRLLTGYCQAWLTERGQLLARDLD